MVILPSNHGFCVVILPSLQPLVAYGDLALQPLVTLPSNHCFCGDVALDRCFCVEILGCMLRPTSLGQRLCLHFDCGRRGDWLASNCCDLQFWQFFA